jgi:hypothetical protein
MLPSSVDAVAPNRHLVCLDLLRPEAVDGDEALAAGVERGKRNCRRLLRYGRTVGWTITHVFDHTARSRRSRAIEGLEPLQMEPVLYRTGVSAFSNRMFRESVEDRPDTELIILGLSLSPACLATALAALDRGVTVALVEDALCGSASAADGISAIQTLSRSIAAPFVKITRTDDLIDVRRGLHLIC